MVSIASIAINNVCTINNLRLAYERLLTNPEATYKNYFRNIYATYSMAVDDNIRNLSSKMRSGYVAGTPYKIYIPKTNGLNRMYTLMPIEDQIVYQAFANKLADQMQIEVVKKRYKKSVFGNLYAGKESKFFFQKWEDSYKSYTKSIIKAYKAGNGYIASFDLTACYDSINHNLIKDILHKYHFTEECVKQFIRLLEEWCSPSKKHLLGSGIPQGPQASGIIAEAVLGEYDAFIENIQKQYDFKYFRYVDDIKILAKDEETVKWILFLLDKKSKELGLFPQASKVSVHKIEKIEDEIKQISKPLFEDELDEEAKPEIATEAIIELVKNKSRDITTIKRYFQYVEPNTHNNKLALKLLGMYPEMISSFVYYVRRYPRKLPETILNYIKECCEDKTKQYYAGLLLQVSVYNMSSKAVAEFGSLADSLLKKDNRHQFIYDFLFKEQLYLLLILSKIFTTKTYINRIKREKNWWIHQELLSDLYKCNAPDEIVKKVVNHCLISQNQDEALCATMLVVINSSSYALPARNMIAPIAQVSLKQAGVIQRSKYSSSQINKYLEKITEQKWNFQWKTKLGADHDYIEKTIFAAMSYWKTDLTAFVNLWDTIDDRVLSIFVPTHAGFGIYTLGKIGGYTSNTKLNQELPKFSRMIIQIHEYRLSSYLSHSKVRDTGNYTGPIPYKENKKINKILIDGMTELINYW